MYLDSAIIVKLLVRGTGQRIVSIVRLAGHAFDTSELALTEMFSALLARRASRANSFRKDSARLAWKQFQAQVADEDKD